MRKIIPALVVGLALGLAPVGEAADASPSNDGATVAKKKKKKKCRAGYVLKTVKKKKRVRGKTRTVRVKKCVKKRKVVRNPTAPVPGGGGGDCGPSVYNGTATNTARTFNYGAVRIDRACNKVNRVEIKAVSTDGCPSSTLTLVYNASDPGYVVLDGSNTITANRMRIYYSPYQGAPFGTRLDITFSGNTAQGSFRSEGVCQNEGVFTATG